jgi:hypothetical protein
MNGVGQLEVVNIRKAFPNEAMHFTKWLETNIETLSERLKIQLTVEQREHSVGDFSVDLLCEDGSGALVIIENQLEKTNHDHLGKLLTYLVNRNANTAIWITTEPRSEHQKVIDWLNQYTPTDISFYLVRVEAVRIDESRLAPLFTILAGPDRQAKELGDQKKEWADRHYKRQEFWTMLLERLGKKSVIFSSISPGKENWIGTGAGKSGVTFNFVINKDWGAAELYIDHDRKTGVKNKEIFDKLHAQKNTIEEEFGDSLDWDRLEERRASRIRKKINLGGLSNQEQWAELQEAMIDAMINLIKALKPRLSKIR